VGLEIVVELPASDREVSQRGYSPVGLLQRAIYLLTTTITTQLLSNCTYAFEVEDAVSCVNSLFVRDPLLQLTKVGGSYWIKLLWPGTDHGAEYLIIDVLGDLHRRSIFVSSSDKISDEDPVYVPTGQTLIGQNAYLEVKVPDKIVFRSSLEVSVRWRSVSYKQLSATSYHVQSSLSVPRRSRGVRVGFREELKDLRHLVTITSTYRSALMSKATDAEAAFISGKNVDGTLLTDHIHPFIVPWYGEKGGVKGVVITSSLPVEPLIERVARKVRTVYLRGLPPIEIAYVTVGYLDDVFGELSGGLKLRSYTPYIPTRFMHRDDTVSDFVAEDINRELDRRGVEPARHVRFVNDQVRPVPIFDRTSSLKDGRRVLYGYLIELEIATTLDQTLHLGKLCHFGMGAFYVI